jgi:hypothetical protein
MNEKRKWITAGRFRRGAVILAAVGLTAGAVLGTAGSAMAAGVGSEPGSLVLTPSSGALTVSPTLATTSACPSGFQTSATVAEFTVPAAAGPTPATTIAPVTSSGLNSATGFSIGALDLGATVGSLLDFGSVGISATNPGTVEWAVGCWSGAGGTGTVEYTQSIFVTATAAGNYTTSATAPTQTATTTTLAVSPSTGVTTATSVTLTATVTAADGTAPAGTVTFFNTATSPATVVGTAGAAVTWTTTAPITGTATTSATFAAGSYSLDAVFTPTSATYASSTSAASALTVTTAGSTNAGGTNPVPITVTVAATGTLSVTVASTPTTLTVSGSTATGTLPDVTINDTRNSFPGWSVSGQESNFTSPATPSTPIPGSDLGWIPAAATGSGTFDGTDVVLGGTVAPGTTTNGLGSGAVLALAHAGFGAGGVNYIATAALTLDIPASTTAGTYTGDLTITYLQSQT